MSFQDLVTMVKNLSEESAAHSEEMKKLKADNAALQRELNGKREDDRILSTAKDGRFANLEKLLDAKSESVKSEISALNRSLKSTIEASIKHVEKTDEDFGEVYAYINERNTNEEILRIHGAMEIGLANLWERDDQVKKQLAGFETTMEALGQKQQVTTEEISSLEATVKDLGVELRMDVLKIQEQFKSLERSQDVAFNGLEAEMDRIRDFALTEEKLLALDGTVLVDNEFFYRLYNDVGFLDDSLSITADHLHRTMDKHVKDIDIKVEDRLDEHEVVFSKRLRELEEERGVATATQKSVSDKLENIDAEFLKVDEAFAEAGRQAREVSREISSLKMRELRDDSRVLIAIEDLKERFNRLKQDGKTPAIADLEEMVNELNKDAKTTQRTVEEQNQLIWSIDNKHRCAGGKIEKKMNDAGRRIGSLERNHTSKQSGTGKNQSLLSKNLLDKSEKASFKSNEAFETLSLLDAQYHEKFTDVKSSSPAPKGYKARTVEDGDNEEPTRIANSRHDQGVVTEHPEYGLSESKNVPTISVIRQMSGVDADMAADIQSKIEASEAAPASLRAQAADFKPGSKMSNWEYEQSQEHLAGWVPRYWPNGARMFGEWEVDDAYVGWEHDWEDHVPDGESTASIFSW